MAEIDPQRGRRFVPSKAFYHLIVRAEQGAREAHNASYQEGAPYFLRTALGKAQSLLMHYVVKYADVIYGDPPKSPASHPPARIEDGFGV